MVWANKNAQPVPLANVKTAGTVRCPLAGAWPYPLTHQTFIRRGGVGGGWRDRQERGDGGGGGRQEGWKDRYSANYHG